MSREVDFPHFVSFLILSSLPKSDSHWAGFPSLTESLLTTSSFPPVHIILSIVAILKPYFFWHITSYPASSIQKSFQLAYQVFLQTPPLGNQNSPSNWDYIFLAILGWYNCDLHLWYWETQKFFSSRVGCQCLSLTRTVKSCMHL